MFCSQMFKFKFSNESNTFVVNICICTGKYYIVCIIWVTVPNKSNQSKTCVVLSVSFCTGHFVMVPLNLTYLHCLQHSLFEHLFYIVTEWKFKCLGKICVVDLLSNNISNHCYNRFRHFKTSINFHFVDT